MRSTEQGRVDKLDEAWLVSTVRSLQERGFYGTLEIKIENGSLRRLETRTSIVPPHANRPHGAA